MRYGPHHWHTKAGAEDFVTKKMHRHVARWLALSVTAVIILGVAVVAGRRWLERRDVASDARRPATTAPPNFVSNGRPSLWVLAIGVSRYAEPALRLRFASADALAVADALARQRGGPLYSDVKTTVLVDADATRPNILRALGNSFFGNASLVDVGVIYVAGHGVRDEARNTYYFLPATAAADEPYIDGLDWSEFRQHVQQLHRNLRQLVVIVDTCHAGGAVERAHVQFGKDLAAELVQDDGLYVLAAAESGKPSVELPQFEHGAFTYALLDGLQGAAANPNGLITVTRLASHAAWLVPELTAQQQRPYLKIIGGDLALAAHPQQFARITPPSLPSPVALTTPLRAQRIVVKNFKNLSPDPDYDHLQQVLGQQFLTAFSAAAQLDVLSPDMVRFLAHEAPESMEAAERVGAEKLLEGTYWVQDHQITISAAVMSVRPLRRLASNSLAGPVDQVAALSGQLSVDLLKQLGADVPPAVVERIIKPRITNFAALNRLLEADKPRREPSRQHKTPRASPPPETSLRRRVLEFLDVAQVSYATEADDGEAALLATLDGYRNAFAQQDIETLAGYYAEFTDEQRAALTRYFENVTDLRVQFSNVRVAISGDRAAVSFTREDQFIDRDTGDRQEVVMRVTKLFVKRAKGWKIVP